MSNFYSREKDLEANKRADKREHNHWEKYWEPAPCEKPGMFQSWKAVGLAIAKVFGSIIGATLILSSFILAVIHQPTEAIVAGAGCFFLGLVFWKLGRDEADTFWKIMSFTAALWLTVMGFLAWGVAQ